MRRRSTILSLFCQPAICCGLLLCAFAAGWADDETKPQAEKEFGRPAAQSEWLKTPPLPEWTEKTHFVENEIEYYVAEAPASMTAADAEAELDRQMQRIAREWIRERFSAEAAEHLEVPVSTIRDDWMVNHELVPCVMELPSAESYAMYRSFAQLAMTDKVVKQVTGLWTARKAELMELRQRDRLTQWTVIGGALLLLLASVHSYLRMDFVTRGYHTRRLQLMLGAAIAAIIGMSVWLLNVLF